MIFRWFDAKNEGTYFIQGVTNPDNFDIMLEYAGIAGEEELPYPADRWHNSKK